MDRLHETNEYKEMNTYPYYSSIKKIDEYMVMKFDYLYMNLDKGEDKTNVVSCCTFI